MLQILRVRNIRPFAVPRYRPFHGRGVQLGYVVVTTRPNAEYGMVANHPQGAQPDLRALVVVRIALSSVEKLLNQCGTGRKGDGGNCCAKQENVSGPDASLPHETKDAETGHRHRRQCCST